MRSLLGRLVLVAIAAMVVTVGNAGPASAHTGFESSDPSEGEVVSAGLATVTIVFTNEAEPAGDGFVVLDPDLGRREPEAVDRPEVGTFVLRFDPPISVGEVGVRWTVQAPDAHPIEGSFRFTVDASGSPDGTAQSGQDGPGTGASSSTAESDDALEQFLATESGSTSGRVVSDIGRLLAMTGMLVSLGFIAFATLVMRGTPSELRMLLFWIRRASVAVVFGTALDCAGYVADISGQGFAALVDPTAYGDALSLSAWSAYLLRAASGVIVAATARISMVHVHDAKDVIASVTSAVPVGAGSTRIADHASGQWSGQDVAWDLDRAGALPVVGFAAMLVSHTFDGHTVTEGNRVLTGLASATHVFAAAIWVGGVAALALIVRRRSRRGERTHALMMVTRFSVLATGALAAVTVFGLYLSWVILDSPSDLWATPWGRLLIAKLVVVAVAAGLGAHNHHVVVPALERSEEDGATVARLRSTLRFEVAALAAVTVLTALLVRAASTI